MSQILKKALARLWLGSQPKPSQNGADVIQQLERQYHITLPEEFAVYLKKRAPSSDHMDDGGIVWWAPQRIANLRNECGPTPENSRNIQIESEADRYIVFADYADWCGYGYAICCSDGPNRGKVALIGESPNRFVAKSFPSFVNLAAEDSMRLHSPGGDSYTDII